VIKISEEKSDLLPLYKKAFSIIWVICINTIPIINSSFLEPFFNENISYLREYWIWFLLLGIIFFTLGIKIYSLKKKILNDRQGEDKEDKLVTTGVYNIVRHPSSMAWILIFLGSTFILDSFISFILTPFIVILTEVTVFLKEKYFLTPKYGEVYENYKKKTPYRVLSPPYNYLLFIIAIFAIYIGFLNFEYFF
jgi:protein-S-isoprenylcysteine O-methyltransferase Ste14